MVEASTLGSEFIILKAYIIEITHLRYKLRVFGIPLIINYETRKSKAT